MGLTVKRAGAEEYGTYMKVLVGGDSGSGKTRFSSTFPDVLFLSTDPGLMSVVDRQPAYVDVSSSADVEQLLIVLRQGSITQQKLLGMAPKTLIFDTIDDYQRMLIRERLAETHKDTLAIQDYGWLGDQMRNTLKAYRNLPMNVVFCVHLKDDKDDETGRTYIKPQLVGQFCNEVSALVDLAVLIKTQQVTKAIDGVSRRVEQRLLQTSGDANHPWIKDRSGQLPRPEFEIDLTTDYEVIYKAIFGGRDLRASEELGRIESQPAASSVTPDAKAAADKKKSTTASKAAAKAAPPLPVAEAPAAPVAEPPAPPDEEDKAEQPAVLETSEEPEAESGEHTLTEEAAPPSTSSEVESVPPAAEPVPEAGTDNTEVSPDPDMICEGCGNPIENEDQRDLSKLRFRKKLCRPCFKEAKAEAKK